jgi:hypothetical protein
MVNQPAEEAQAEEVKDDKPDFWFSRVFGGGVVNVRPNERRPSLIYLYVWADMKN